MSTSFRLRVCIKDEPGALLRILKTLSGQMQGNILQNEHQDAYAYEVVPDIHMFTLKRCSRFPVLYTTNPRIAGSLFLRPHYLFHAIIELKLRKRREEGNGKDKENESKTIAVLELHACLVASDRGVKASNFRKFIQSLTKLRYLNIEGNDQGSWTNLQPPERVIYAGTLSPLSVGGISEYPKSLRYLRDALRNIVIEGNESEDTECPERGTCPLGFIVHNEKNLRELYKHKFTRTLLIKQNEENHDVTGHVNYDVYLTFIRDHECYAKYRSFEEYYGIIMPNEKDHPHIEKFTRPFKVNSVVIDVIYVDGETDKIRTDRKYIMYNYIKSVLEDLMNRDYEGVKEYLTNVDLSKSGRGTDRSNSEEQPSYIVSKYFTCEDPSCDVTRRFMPKLSLPRVI